jgi:hypothetical protein
MRTWTLIFSIVSTVITLVLAVLGYWTLEVSTRAWVGPVKGTALIDDTGTVTFKITYKNSGKEPAVQFGDDWADDWSAISEDSSAKFDFYSNCKSDGGLGRCSERAARWQRTHCDSKQTFQDRIAFPDFSYTHSKNGLRVDKADHNRIVVVQGCFVYKSNVTPLGSVHRSAFCYYYRVGQQEDEMRACPVGNSAT